MKTNIDLDLAQRTKQCFKDIHMTDGEVAQALGVHLMTVGRWRRGESVPRRKEFKKLEDFVSRLRKGVTRHIESIVEREPVVLNPEQVNIPILSNIPKQWPKNVIEEKVGTINIPAWALGANYKNCYALKIEEELPPYIHRGDTVIVKLDIKPRVGEFIIVRADNGYTLKELKQKSKDEIVGVVIYLITKHIKKTANQKF